MSGRKSKLVKPDPQKSYGEGDWQIFHLLLAFMAILGFLSPASDLAGLLEALHHLNSLEESGLAVSLVILARSVVRAIGVLIGVLHR